MVFGGATHVNLTLSTPLPYIFWWVTAFWKQRNEQFVILFYEMNKTSNAPCICDIILFMRPLLDSRHSINYMNMAIYRDRCLNNLFLLFEWICVGGIDCGAMYNIIIHVHIKCLMFEYENGNKIIATYLIARIETCFKALPPYYSYVETSQMLSHNSHELFAIRKWVVQSTGVFKVTYRKINVHMRT